MDASSVVAYRIVIAKKATHKSVADVLCDNTGCPVPFWHIHSNILLIIANYWKAPDNRRKFFIDFASKNIFDPRVSENWNKITKEYIVKQVRNKKSERRLIV